MRNLLFALLAVAACKSNDRHEEAKTAGPATRLEGRITEVWEVVDKTKETRIGWVEKYLYEDGQYLYWVSDPARDVKHGYILGNNSAFKYVWYAGQRTRKAEPIGADTISANARRILGYEFPVALRRSSLEAILAELRAKQAARKAGDAKDAGAGDGDTDADDDEE